MNQPELQENLALNLRLLCSYYRSIAEVCRRLDINRPQFNRYLSGRYKPSASTLRRLCEFFGVEEQEILLPHAQFQRLVQVRPQSRKSDAAVRPEFSHLDRLAQRGNAGLERYLGYYFEYYLSMANPGKMIRTLICLEEHDGRVYYQRTERMVPHPGEPPCHNRYLGMAYLLSDRIFLLDYESLNCHEITQTILFPSFRKRLSRLTGLKLGVSDNSERMPCCARVLFEYLGTEVDPKKALALCGLYELDSPGIDASILESVRNEVGAAEWHFRARH